MKALALANDLLRVKPENKTVYPDLSSFKIEVNPRIEGYIADYEAGELHIKAANSLIAAFATYQIKRGFISGYLAEHLNHKKPRFPMRAYWPKAAHLVALNSFFEIPLPLNLSKEVLEQPHLHPDLDLFCYQLIESGYNTVILGAIDHKIQQPLLDIKCDFQQLIEAFRNYGIKVVLKPKLLREHHPSLVKEAIERLTSSIDCDYLFWENREPYHQNFIAAQSRYDAIIDEIYMLEKLLPESLKLMYCLTSQTVKEGESQASYLEKIANEISEKTILAYHAQILENTNKQNHPFWHLLRRIPTLSQRNLFPLFQFQDNNGLDFEKGLKMMLRHPFIGACNYSHHDTYKEFFETFRASGQLLW